jgi:hypothetical protein
MAGAAQYALGAALRVPGLDVESAGEGLDILAGQQPCIEFAAQFRCQGSAPDLLPAAARGALRISSSSSSSISCRSTSRRLPRPWRPVLFRRDVSRGWWLLLEIGEPSILVASLGRSLCENFLIAS